MDRLLTFETDGQDRTIWAERREPTPGDDVVVGAGTQLWDNQEAVYKVRSLGNMDYQIGQRFRDEDGKIRAVRGLRKVGRTHYEILGRIL